MSKSAKVPCGRARKRNSAMCFSLLASQSCGHRKLYASSIVASCASAQRKFKWFWRGNSIKRFNFNSAFSTHSEIVLRFERKAGHICCVCCRCTARRFAHNFFNGCVLPPNLTWCMHLPLDSLNVIVNLRHLTIVCRILTRQRVAHCPRVPRRRGCSGL